MGLDPLPKKTRKEVFFDEMNQVVPWAALVEPTQRHARGAHQALGGRPPFPIGTVLRIHCLRLWWNLSDPAMEEELHERPLYRRFVGLEDAARRPDETTPRGSFTRPADAAFRRVRLQSDSTAPSRRGFADRPSGSVGKPKSTCGRARTHGAASRTAVHGSKKPRVVDSVMPARRSLDT